MWYNGIFYCVYKFIRRFDKRGGYPDYVHWITSLLFISAQIGLNLMVIQFVLEHFFELDFGHANKYYIYPVVILNLFYFFYGGKYKAIIAMLDSWTRKRKLIACFATIFYLVFTLGTFILIAI